MSLSKQEFVDKWLASWTGNRPEAVLSFYTPDAHYIDPANPSGLHGHEALRRYLTKLLAKYPDWIWEPVVLVATETGFILKWKVSMEIEGNRRSAYGMDLVELTQDLISRNEVYFDPSHLIR